jgi:arylsulfatase A-like enzyme
MVWGTLASECFWPTRQPNVLLIENDTLRADHLGCHGHARPTSPHLDRLAERGTRFARARAPSSWTLPSVASIMTGTYPVVHGAERNTSGLASSVPTMAQAFHAAGYTTAARSANAAFVTPFMGLARGFGSFEVLRGSDARRGSDADASPADPWLWSSVEVAKADAVTAAALTWVDEHAADEAPFFLYLHYFDPHAAYFPPPEMAARFGVPPDAPLTKAPQWKLLLAPTAPASAEDLATLVALYDAEIAYTDAAIGTLLDGVATRTRRPTLVVVTADHGEEFGEHGGVQHGRTLFDELLHVPLIVHGPGVAARRVVETPVSLVSLWATIADLAGVAGPPTSDGPSLVGLMRGEAPPARHPLFADLEPRFPNDRHVHRRAIVDGSWKLVLAPDRKVRLFDLANDPTEQHGLDAADGRDRLLRAELRVREVSAALRRAQAPPEELELTAARRAQLKALGYLQ